MNAPSPDPSAVTPLPRRGRVQTLEYVEDMLLELAHMASLSREATLATSLAVVALQCRTRINEVSGRRPDAA